MTTIRTGNHRRKRHQMRASYYEGVFGIRYVDADGINTLEIVDVFGRNRTRGSRLRLARAILKRQRK